MLFGYAPDYVTNEVYFDPENRAYVRHRTASLYVSNSLMVLEPDGWVERPFVEAIRAALPDYVGTHFGGGFLGAKVAFDGRGGAYTLLSVRRRDGSRCGALLFTPDRGEHYQVLLFPADEFDIEQFTGHNALSEPPPVLSYVFTRPHPARFCGYYDLFLYLPRREGDRVSLGDPVKVTDNCLGSCQHSGGPASTATRNGKTHIVWGEVAPDNAAGVPTWTATFDHATRTLGKKVYLADAPPVNDVHNVPAITIDRAGYLHIVTGAHGEPFQYLRSLKPNDTAAGFTKPVPVLSEGCVETGTGPRGRGRQTYISLVCGPDDTLHLVCRQWRAGVDSYHGGALYAALSYQRKPKNAPWEPARPLVIPPLPGYSIYYHKLSIDRTGRLFLSYSYYSGEPSYQEEFPDRYHHQAVMLSADGGDTWKLAETDDFRPPAPRRKP
ncbi:MAG: BNR-4 repeat-containing protein, partial [Armatimonadota bacterium]|nr:BNR-4 repeat-containing protein [Armatimonadota bacterium]